LSTLVLLDGVPGHWLRIEDGAIVARGERPAVVADSDTRVVGIVSGVETVVHSLAIEGLTDAQARGAAKLAMADTAVVPVEQLHIAVGPETEGARVAVAIDATRMTQRLVDLAAEGFDPDALVPALLVPPVPESGFVRALLGEEAVVRGFDVAFVDDAVLTPLLAPGEIVTLDREATEAALVAAVLNPPVDLRQGAFAKRRRWAVDRTKLNTIQWLVAACLASLILVPLATLINLNWTASSIEARNIARAQAAMPGVTVVNPVAQLDERLGAFGLQNGGFLPLSAAMASAIEAVPGVEVERLSYSGPEGLKAGIRAPNPADMQALSAKVGARWGIVQAGTPQAPELTVKRP
jgi:general secretion pathway protein L